MDNTKGTRNLVVMLAAVILVTLLVDFVAYAYTRHVADNHYAVRANVLEINYTDPLNRGSYANTLTVRVLVELDHTFVERIINDGSSSERLAFANATRVGDRIVIWVDRRNQEISLFEPPRPRLFSTPWLTDETAPQRVAKR